MEKINCICVMRDLYKAMVELEANLTENYGISLNEAMVMCSIGGEKLPAGTIAARTGLRSSHLSKVLRSVEEKGFLCRNFGDKDKRQVYFSLTDEAEACLKRLKKEGLEIPGMLKPFF